MLSTCKVPACVRLGMAGVCRRSSGPVAWHPGYEDCEGYEDRNEHTCLVSPLSGAQLNLTLKYTSALSLASCSCDYCTVLSVALLHAV